MTLTPAPLTLIAPPGASVDTDSAEPWMTTAADILAAASERPGRGQRLVPTGNEELGELAPGTLTVVVGPPGPTATAALVRVAHYSAYRHQRPTLLYPLRSTLHQLAGHLADAHSRSGDSTTDAAPGVHRDLRECPLNISVGSRVSVTRIHFDAVDPDIDAPHLIVVDAVDLLLPAGACRDLKHLALELNAAVLCSTTVRCAPDGTVAPSDVPANVASIADTIVVLTPTDAEAPTPEMPSPTVPVWKRASDL